MCVIFWIYCSLSATQSFKVCITGNCTGASGLWCANNDFTLTCLGSFPTCSGCPRCSWSSLCWSEKDCKRTSYAQENTPKAESSSREKRSVLQSTRSKLQHPLCKYSTQQPGPTPQTAKDQRSYVIMSGGHLLGRTCVIFLLGLFCRIWAWLWAVLTHFC